MKRNLKALSLTLAAAFALTAIGASAAQAEPAEFTADDYPAVVKGDQEPETENFFRITGPEGGKTECPTAVYEATQTQASSTLTVTPHYPTTCTSSGFTTHIALNGCHYDFHAGTKKAGGSTGTVDVVCPDEQSITITVTVFGTNACQIHIPPQTGLGPVTYTNKGGDTVTVKVEIDNIKYTHTDLNGFCPFAGGGSGEDGEFTSSVLMTGDQDDGSEAHPTTEGRETYLQKGVGTSIDVG